MLSSRLGGERVADLTVTTANKVVTVKIGDEVTATVPIPEGLTVETMDSPQRPENYLLIVTYVDPSKSDDKAEFSDVFSKDTKVSSVVSSNQVNSSSPAQEALNRLCGGLNALGA